MWSIRDARIALVARALSAAGTSVTAIAAMLLLYANGAGELGVAAFLAALAIPTIATMGIAGRVADTADSRTVLVATALVQAAAVAALAIAHTIPVIFASGVVIALAQAFAQPTWSALLPRIVGEDHIGQAISWQQGLTAVASPLGAGLGGVLVAMDDVAVGFWINAATYLILAAAALAIRTRRQATPTSDGADGAHGSPPPRSSWTAGVRLVARDRILLPLFIAILVFVVLVEGINPVEVFLVRDALGATEWEYGLTELFAGAGGVAGAAVAARMPSDRIRARVATIGFGTAALMLIILGSASSFWLYAVLLTAMTAAFATGNATFGALLTSRTPDAYRGRVYAALGGFARTASLIALALGGVANVLLGPRTTFIVAGITGALVMLIAAWAVLRAQRHEATAPDGRSPAHTPTTPSSADPPTASTET